MKTSAIPTVILLLMSIDCITNDNIKQICDILKPGGVFKSIKVSKAIEFYESKRFIHRNIMYGKGMLWQFVATNKSIHLLDETLTANSLMISGKSESVLLRVDFKEVWLTGEVPNHCFITSDLRKRGCLRRSRPIVSGNIKNPDYFKSDTVIAFDPIPEHNTTLGHLNARRIAFFDTTASKVSFYSFQTDVLDTNCIYSECKAPIFVQKVDSKRLSRLTGIIDMTADTTYPTNSWLLLFNDQSKPVFCMIDKTTGSGCSANQMIEFGHECNGKKDKDKDKGPDEPGKSGLNLVSFAITAVVALVVAILGVLIGYWIRSQKSDDKPKPKAEMAEKSVGFQKPKSEFEVKKHKSSEKNFGSKEEFY